MQTRVGIDRHDGLSRLAAPRCSTTVLGFANNHEHFLSRYAISEGWTVTSMTKTLMPRVSSPVLR